VVERRVNGAWQEYARGLFGALALTNLTPGTTYTFRVYSIPVEGLGYTTSARSAPISFTTLSGPDSVPPSTPPAPLFSSVTTSAANVFWGEATDNVQVTGYHLQQLIGGVFTTIRTVSWAQRFQSVGGLAPGASHTFAVIAFDARGNQSPRSAPGTVTTLATTAALICRVQVIVYSAGRQFAASVTLINTTTTATNGWTIGFVLPASMSTAGVFSGALTRTGDTGTLTPLVWSRVIGPGGQLSVGFSGGGAAAIPPSGFTADGVPCTTV
jgi:hypothetical protein